MSKILKLIWRFDFKVSYAFLNRRGDALGALIETVPDFLESVREKNQNRVLTAETITDEGQVQISATPNTINGSIEWNQGVKLDEALKSRQFRDTTEVANNLVKTCDIRLVERGGFRLMGVTDSPYFRTAGAERNMFDKAVLTLTEAALGEMEDSAAIFEGKDEDALYYRISIGRTARKNISATLSKELAEEVVDTLSEMNAFFDLDLHERSFELGDASLYRWAVTKLGKAQKFVDMYSALRREE